MVSDNYTRKLLIMINTFNHVINCTKSKHSPAKNIVMVILSTNYICQMRNVLTFTALYKVE